MTSKPADQHPTADEPASPATAEMAEEQARASEDKMAEEPDLPV